MILDQAKKRVICEVLFLEACEIRFPKKNRQDRVLGTKLPRTDRFPLPPSRFTGKKVRRTGKNEENIKMNQRKCFQTLNVASLDDFLASPEHFAVRRNVLPPVPPSIPRNPCEPAAGGPEIRVLRESFQRTGAAIDGLTRRMSSLESKVGNLVSAIREVRDLQEQQIARIDDLIQKMGSKSFPASPEEIQPSSQKQLIVFNRDDPVVFESQWLSED